MLPIGLKGSGRHLSPWEGCSDALVVTHISSHQPVRDAYLKSYKDANPPVVSSSEFVPSALVEHLMRSKKDSALGVKFLKWGRRDRITNLEGAIHTYCTPLVLAAMHGDYIYRRRHGVVEFRDHEGRQTARTVVMSALIQPDFENEEVMLMVSALRNAPSQGELLPDNYKILHVDDKQDDLLRDAYDETLRRHIIANLLEAQRLPTVDDAKPSTISFSDSILLLESAITEAEQPIASVRDRFVLLRSGYVLSLELLFSSAYHQARNELSCLEQMCPQGYVYTFDPPAIFAREVGATLLNRLHFAALRQLASGAQFAHMRVYAFNDYVDEDAVDLLKAALASQKHVQVMAKKALFVGPGETYVAPQGAEGALLVVHNNSDAFGQNIETEGPRGSMDGALGTYSSAAASLHRRHPQLTSQLM